MQLYYSYLIAYVDSSTTRFGLTQPSSGVATLTKIIALTLQFGSVWNALLLPTRIIALPTQQGPTPTHHRKKLIIQSWQQDAEVEYLYILSAKEKHPQCISHASKMKTVFGSSFKL
jgi:hypothetical protein